MRVTKGSHVMDIYYDELRTKMLVSNTYGTFYYMVNAQGDVTGLVNSSGVRVVEYHYDAWAISCLPPDPAALAQRIPCGTEAMSTIPRLACTTSRADTMTRRWVGLLTRME